MKRVSITIGVAMTLIVLIGGGCQTGFFTESQITTQQQESLERNALLQKRINRYFHSDVFPKLKTCWSGIQGAGSIAIRYTYTKDASGKWVWDGLAADRSTLPKGQEAIALACMQQSVRGTSFPVQPNDGTGDRFVVIWNWPVPFPPNADEQWRDMFAARAAGGGSGGMRRQGSATGLHT